MNKRVVSLALGLTVLAVLNVGCREEQEEHVFQKQIIAIEAAPKAIGPYSQAVKVGPWLFASGQIAIDPSTGQLVTHDFEREARRVLDNIGAVLRAAGMDYADVVQATVFLSDLSLYGKLNQIYADYFKGDFPARCAVQVARLPKDVHVEIAVTAYRGGE